MVQFSPSVLPDVNNRVGEPLEPVRENLPDRGGFLGELKARVQEVDALQKTSDRLVEEGAVKGASNVHETMIQLEKADLSLRMMLRVRDKAISAYQEIMRMQF